MRILKHKVSLAVVVALLVPSALGCRAKPEKVTAYEFTAPSLPAELNGPPSPASAADLGTLMTLWQQMVRFPGDQPIQVPGGKILVLLAVSKAHEASHLDLNVRLKGGGGESVILFSALASPASGFQSLGWGIPIRGEPQIPQVVDVLLHDTGSPGFPGMPSPQCAAWGALIDK